MMGTRSWLLAGILLGIGAASGAAQRSRDSLPPGVTPAMIEEGKRLFQGPGLCIACHGPEGKGSIGPDLTDTVWIHGKGSFAEIATLVLRGVPQEESQSGTPMPPRGGSGLSDAELRLVAAYVWRLAHSKRR